LLCGRQLLKNPICDGIDASGDLVVVDDAEILFERFGFDFAEFKLLLRCENVFRGRAAESRRRGARLRLLSTRCGSERKSGSEESSGWCESHRLGLRISRWEG
jgi:hypothetical protein